MRFFLPVLLLWATAATSAPPKLPDQFGELYDLSAYTSEPVVLIFAPTRKLRWIGKWEKALRAELPELKSLRIADIRDEPKPDIDDVAATLKKRAPKDVSILIDIDNLWATIYQLDTEEPNVVLLNSNHEVVEIFRGRPKRDLLSRTLITVTPYFAPSDAT